jgi:hypothetical protein
MVTYYLLDRRFIPLHLGRLLRLSGLSGLSILNVPSELEACSLIALVMYLTLFTPLAPIPLQSM